MSRSAASLHAVALEPLPFRYSHAATPVKRNGDGTSYHHCAGAKNGPHAGGPLVKTGGEPSGQPRLCRVLRQQMPLEHEVLLHRPEARQECLRAFRVMKATHSTLAFARRLMAILSPVVDAGSRLDELVLHTRKFRNLGLRLLDVPYRSEVVPFYLIIVGQQHDSFCHRLTD